MILGWHVQGPGFKPRPDHLKLLLHNSWTPSIGWNSKVKKGPGKVLTLEIGLRWIFRSLISSSIIQTKTLAAKKFWMKIFAHSISTQVEPFPHNKHPLEHGSTFLVANSCAIGQLQWVYGLAIMSLLFMEWIKPDLKLITEHDPPMVVMGLLLCNSWFGAMESATDF